MALGSYPFYVRDPLLEQTLSDPTRPQILAVERGRDTTAALKCLDRLTQEQRQQVRTHRVDMGPAYPAACALRLPHSRAVTDRFHVAKKFNEVVDSLRKNITREYKAKLTKDQRKAFRSQMWAFRRDPESLSAEEKQALEALFEKIPALRPLYKVRLRFKEIFDTARDRITAARWLRELRRECGQLGLDLGPFFETYDRWKTKILNYFDARQTSAAVEGINNKARVITKRTYGLKSAKSLWDRLILDLNRASQAGVIAPVPGIMRLFWAFSPSTPPESPSQEDSSLANMLDTLEARCRSDGPPAGPRSIDPLPGSRSFLTVSAVA